MAEVQGLDAFRKTLKAIDPQWGRALSKANRVVAKDVADKARGRASSFGASQRKMAGAIKGSGTQRAASIRVTQSSRYPFANPAFWGKIKRSGWYKGGHGRAQTLPWVGANWEAGVKGQGPYVINDTIADDLPHVLEQYGQMLDELFSHAFPS